ncbi:hypothetical protein R1sor_008881 [Riccia sorocarpa]|uniref:FCP1 homology domain-containing protein n=1 Tax=Riccia sorocarpa TaxID=122646 RepID=A0ABD3H704_9MARC
MRPEAKNILGNRARIESVTEAIAEEFKDKQEDEGSHLLPNLLSEVNGGTDIITSVSSEVGGGSDLILALPSEVNGGTAEVPTLPSDFIPRVEDDSGEERSVAEITKGTETEEHHGEVHVEHIEEHQEPSEQANAPGLAAQTLDVIDNNQVVDAEITESDTINTVEVDDQMSFDQREDVRIESGPLAPIETPISLVPDVNQVPNPLVKVSDLLPRKLLILDVERLLVYVEGFMDKSSKTAAGDVIGAKKVIRRNGVQDFITRCLELFDIALWTCSDRNLLHDYTYYLFSGEQYGKFLFRWDHGKALDTKERWTRNN